jgi:hypothetical protein
MLDTNLVARDIKIIRQWVTFFGVLTVISLLITFYTMLSMFYHSDTSEDTPTTHSFSGAGAGGDFKPTITIDATEAPDASN